MAPSEEDAEKKEEEKTEEEPIVKELKELDDSYLSIEREYEKALLEIQKKYDEKRQPLLEERKKLLTVAVEDGPKTGTPALRGFWLQAMQNHPAFDDCMEECDEPVLEYVSDVEKALLDDTNESKGFNLVFHFVENPYIENSELSIEFHKEEGSPYLGEIDVKEIKATEIKWKPGKNVTVKTVARKVKGGGAKKNKKKGETEEPQPSFFSRFVRNIKPGMEDAAALIQLAGDEYEVDEGDEEEFIKMVMDQNHEIGRAMCDNIIPFAVRWYTGEANPNYDDDDEDSEEEDDEEDEESEDEPAPKGKAKAGGKAAAKAKEKKGKRPASSPKNKPSANPEQPKNECKQQ